MRRRGTDRTGRRRRALALARVGARRARAVGGRRADPRGALQRRDRARPRRPAGGVPLRRGRVRGGRHRARGQAARARGRARRARPRRVRARARRRPRLRVCAGGRLDGDRPRASFLQATAAAARGDVAAARRWLLVREFRPPTRFSRASADATLALDRLSERRLGPAAAAAAVRTDLLDTYDGRLRAALDVGARGDGLRLRRAPGRGRLGGRRATGASCAPPTSRSAAPPRAARTDALVAGARPRGERRHRAALARPARGRARGLPRGAALRRGAAAARRPAPALHRARADRVRPRRPGRARRARLRDPGGDHVPRRRGRRVRRPRVDPPPPRPRRDPAAQGVARDARRRPRRRHARRPGGDARDGPGHGAGRPRASPGRSSPSGGTRPPRPRTST